MTKRLLLPSKRGQIGNAGSTSELGTIKIDVVTFLHESTLSNKLGNFSPRVEDFFLLHIA